MNATAPASLTTRCCIVGGGPAGMMLGFLLARGGIDVTLLEKHADFLRDFRGDTIHPSTLELMHELGLLDEFLKLPHGKATTLTGQVGQYRLTMADFSHLPVRSKFVAFMPQWDFLNFLAEHGKNYPNFHLLMRSAATDLLFDGARVTGVRATTPDGEIEIRADLTVGCDGRDSLLRDRAKLAVNTLGAPMDVLWFRLSRRPGDPEETVGAFDRGLIFVEINRGDYWQCAYVIPKGGIDEVRRDGLPRFRDNIGRIAPFLHERAQEITDWDQVKLLSVAVDRLPVWHRDGLLFIGDAAHAMSPIGGVGVNLAVQDAVAAANLLYAPLKAGRPSEADLAKVQQRREWPAAMTQRVQVFLQNRVISRVLSGAPIKPPLVARLLNWIPLLRRIPARLIGLGVRPEHIGTPDQPG